MQNKNSPSYELAAYRDQEPDLTLCRDVAGGTSKVRAAGTAYLPKHPAEDYADFTERLERSVMYGAFGRTVRGLAGMVFRRDPELSEDVPDKIATDLEDIDLKGNAVDVFVRKVFEDALEAGHCAILVDAPTGEPAPNRAAESMLGMRPYWVHIPKENVINWRTTRESGRLILDQVTIREETTEPNGEYGESEVTHYRVYRRDGQAVTWTLYVERDTDKLVEEASGVIANVTEIPLVAMNITGELFVSDPPLLDLAHVNVAHYQVQSDHLTALHKSSVPVGVATGINPDGEVAIGPNVMLKLPEGADFKYAEHGGKALDSTRQQLQDFKQDMATLGLSMLMAETRAAETAEAKRLDRAEQDSSLSVAARSCEDAVNTCLWFHAQMYRLPDGGSISLNRDFERLSLDAQQVQVYAALVAQGQLSLDTLWGILAEGGVLPDGFDPELERAQLEGEMLSLGGIPTNAVPGQGEEGTGQA